MIDPLLPNPLDGRFRHKNTNSMSSMKEHAVLLLVAWSVVQRVLEVVRLRDIPMSPREIKRDDEGSGTRVHPAATGSNGCPPEVVAPVKSVFAL